ncbi:peptidase [Cellulomonas sp. DKR-3]|uniref:Peptidase n=1 Tax=Cellulomonas fulva TaxID=2835530 RepID=A0ABS5TVA8_9CELL|nr:peptidase [Cellulomonas fulva]MBT0993037.1 peptidase [Cellulomonas fulva]
MSKLVKAFVALVVALLAAVAVPAAAIAADPSPAPSDQYGCLEQSADDYGPPLPCELRVQVLSPFCDNEVPKLRYQVEAIGSPNTTVKITWVNPTGADYVLSGLPLSGTVNWPGAVEQNGRGVDWPGWTQLPDGTWVEGDEWDWVRPSVEVRFEVNPEATVTVGYPPSRPECNTNPPSSAVLSDEPELSATGTDALPLALAGGGLVAAGAVALAVAMHHRRRVQE